VPAQASHRRQLTELPDCKPFVIETRQLEVCCPHCRQTCYGKLPPGLEATRQFGPRLEAFVVYRHHQQHLSYARPQRFLREVWGLELSEGGQACIIERAAAAQPQALALHTQLRQSAVVKSDETGARVNGRTPWHWVFHGT
jgi:transposase